MKKKSLLKITGKKIVISLMVVLCLGFTACNGSSVEENMEYSTTLISAINNQNTVEAVLSTEYENLTFSEDFSVEFPDIKSFNTFTMIKRAGVSAQEIYNRFDAAVEQYFPKVFTEEEKKELYQIVGETADGKTISGTFEEINDKLVESKDGNAMYLNSNKGFLQMFGCGYTQTVTGTAAYSFNHSEGESVGMYIAADANTVTERIFVPQSGVEEERVYRLLDGEVKLTDAIAYTEEFFQDDFDKGVANPELVPKVCEAWVVDMGDGIYGYHFTMTPTYQGIRFDAQPMNRAGSSSLDGGRSSKDYDNFPGYAFTIENEKLDSIMIIGGKLDYDIELTETHAEMITAEQATQILSEEVSGHAGLVIERAEFLYTPYSESGEDGSVLTVDAAWRFVGRNLNDGFRYLFYVNAITGEFDYYKYS